MDSHTGVTWRCTEMVKVRNQRLFHMIGRYLSCLAIVALVLAGAHFSHAQGSDSEHVASHVHAVPHIHDAHGAHGSHDPSPHGDVHCGAQILALCADSPALVFNLKLPSAIAARPRAVPAEFSLEPPPPKTC